VATVVVIVVVAQDVTGSTPPVPYLPKVVIASDSGIGIIAGMVVSGVGVGHARHPQEGVPVRLPVPHSSSSTTAATTSSTAISVVLVVVLAVAALLLLLLLLLLLHQRFPFPE
jgi:hypothetical protein